MVWVYNIDDLEFYNPPKYGTGCYSDMLFSPNDLMLQGKVPQTKNDYYNIEIDCYTCDGLTDLGSVSSYFDYVFGMNTAGQRYFNLRLNDWPPEFCTNKCFILKVTVWDLNNKIVFLAYTQKYSVDNCCVVASGITVTMGGGNIATDCSPFPSLKQDNCGNSYMQLLTRFACWDKYTGDYYGMPVITYAHNVVFAFQKISWLNVTMQYLPLEIKRIVALNCKLQKTEKQRNWVFKGKVSFPVWKAMEIENQLLSTYIFMDNVAYSYSGSTPFVLISNCLDIYRLVLQMQECYSYQIEGCSTECDTL